MPFKMTLPTDLENIVNDYVSQMTFSQKFKKCVGEINETEYKIMGEGLNQFSVRENEFGSTICSVGYGNSLRISNEDESVVLFPTYCRVVVRVELFDEEDDSDIEVETDTEDEI